MNDRLIEFAEKIIIRVIDKINIVFVLLLLVLFGVMNKEEVFEWFSAIGKMTANIIP